MSGLADYSAQAALNFVTGQQSMPALVNRFLALFTTAPTSDAGTGGTEVSGTGYARVQVSGQATAAGTISTASNTITMPNVSGFPWITASGNNGAGWNVYDNTNSKQIGTILTWIGTTLTLTGNASNNGSGGTDSLQLSAWPASTASSGNPEPFTLPASVTNGAIITFAQAGAGGWGTVTSFAIYDAITSGNMEAWDYLGNFKWLPFSVTLASPGVLTAPAHGYSNADSVVVTQKFDGTLPVAFTNALLTVANVTTDTFTTGINTATTGNGQVRKVSTQSIPAGVTASFAASALTLTAA